MLAVILFLAALAFHGWGAMVGWKSRNLPGVEFRQAQTALSAYFIDQDSNFDLAYPTPVLGKPWSVPMEFPLYQWTVVVTSRVTGLGLTKAGRAVSLACFYLCLPALFLLLGRWGVDPGRRWLVLALVVTCPLYIFYSRAFLIETMALMLALWFWVAFERSVRDRNLAWLVVAVLAGIGAGLVKVTTFLLYLLPVAAWALGRLWQGRRDRRWRDDLQWMLPALALPFATTIWWVWFTDRIKARNPVAQFLSSENLRDFNLGTLSSHFSPELWALKYRILTEQLTWMPMLIFAGALVLLGARHRVGAALGCVLFFFAALELFPVLYAYHDYYYVANTVALLLAVGLGVVGLAEGPRLRWVGLGAALLLCGGQAWRYVIHYYPDQRGISAGGNGLSDALRAVTRPGEVLVITGQDWNSMTPYFARRRALMLREEMEANEGVIEAALHELAGEKIGALVIAGRPWRELFPLVRQLSLLGLAPEPWLAWKDAWVFLPEDRWLELVQLMERNNFADITRVPGARAPGELTGAWLELADLTAGQRQLFSSLGTIPVRFHSTFAPHVQGVEQDAAFSVHPWTRLVFPVKRGKRVLTANVWFEPRAYQVEAGADPTDGIGITLLARNPGEGPRVLDRLLIDPAGRPGDQGKRLLRMDFNLEEDGEVELVFDPGAKGRDTRDWAWIRGQLTIE